MENRKQLKNETINPAIPNKCRQFFHDRCHRALYSLWNLVYSRVTSGQAKCWGFWAIYQHSLAIFSDQTDFYLFLAIFGLFCISPIHFTSPAIGSAFLKHFYSNSVSMIVKYRIFLERSTSILKYNWQNVVVLCSCLIVLMVIVWVLGNADSNTQKWKSTKTIYTIFVRPIGVTWECSNAVKEF